MSLKTLQTVLKTVSVGSVKLPTPADRVGFGVLVGIDNYPATVLSQGQFPTPRFPEPEPEARSRQEVADMASMPTSGTADPGTAGSVSGNSVRHFGLGCRAKHGTATPTRTAATARATAGAAPAALWRESAATRARHPGSHDRSYRFGSDCQSPDRQDDPWDRDTTSLRRDWCRTAAPTAATGK